MTAPPRHELFLHKSTPQGECERRRSKKQHGACIHAFCGRCKRKRSTKVAAADAFSPRGPFSRCAFPRLFSPPALSPLPCSAAPPIARVCFTEPPPTLCDGTRGRRCRPPRPFSHAAPVSCCNAAAPHDRPRSLSLSRSLQASHDSAEAQALLAKVTAAATSVRELKGAKVRGRGRMGGRERNRGAKAAGARVPQSARVMSRPSRAQCLCGRARTACKRATEEKGRSEGKDERRAKRARKIKEMPLSCLAFGCVSRSVPCTCALAAAPPRRRPGTAALRSGLQVL